MFSLGFGYDNKTCDFKVVRIAYLQDAYGAYTVLPPEVENGGWGFSNGLLVFDLADEKFSEIGLPRELVHVSPLDLSVSLCGGRISMFWYEKGRDFSKSCDRCAVWVMNQYGELESWTKKFVVVLEGGLSHAIGFRGNGEFLVEKFVGDLLSYDPENKEFQNLGIHGGKDSFFLSEYAESLVLLDGILLYIILKRLVPGSLRGSCCRNGVVVPFTQKLVFVISLTCKVSMCLLLTSYKAQILVILF
ncbi:hypothetical protein RND71_012834 [Anisodus tanguticus]|uniref:F-box associated domain-containing protein n=1 Tax=Anisodus tanguticus TaxID=243964 RepID=A0AAE1SG74_9SOLA|nr:hypothetical protein RND71_012834 [Anisodus tanguticus]